MKHRHMEGNICIGGKGNLSGSKHVYEGVKCHVSHTVSANMRILGCGSITYYSKHFKLYMRTFGMDQSNTTASTANFITETQSHY